MKKRRHALNPAKVKAEVIALEKNPPAEVFKGRIDIRRRLSVALLAVLSSVLLSISFSPFDNWYLAYIALVPWGLAVIGGHDKKWAILWAWLGGVVFWAIGLYWLTWITLAGYFLLIALLGVYWLIAGVVIRQAFRRRWPIWITLPVIWVAMEYARAFMLWPVLPARLSGFTWFFLAHSQYKCIRLIQIADITGQYGVSFFVAMVNGAIIDALVQPLFVKTSQGGRITRKIATAVGACIIITVGLICYGNWRVNQKTRTPGPKVGIVQQAFPITVSGKEASEQEIFDAHLDSSRLLIGADCDLVVWPESMVGFWNMDPDYWGRINPDAVIDGTTTKPIFTKEQQQIIRTYQRNLRRLAWLVRQLGCPLLAGGSMPANPPRDKSDPRSVRVCNSALLFVRDETGAVHIIGRYDKIHLVPFSECVPFRHRWPWLYKQLRRFVPPVMQQLEPGEKLVRFEINSDGRTVRFSAPICYEGTFARHCRAMVKPASLKPGAKRVDMLVNISNDGWFVHRFSGKMHASTELDQHLTQYVFRAIENRTPVIRAVNTGISAYIDSTGTIKATVEHLGRRKMVVGNLVVKTFVDTRVSLYSFIGDIFAQIVCLAAGVVIVIFIIRNRQESKRSASKGRKP